MPHASIHRFSKMTAKYGTELFQEGDLYLPENKCPAVICLLHGGFWRMPYDRTQLSSMARDLASHGFAVWNIEYRRLGAEGGGWPGTFNDVIDAVNYLEQFTLRGIELDLEHVIIAGHSAGGHLALWCAAQNENSPSPFSRLRIKLYAAAGLAAVVDLASSYETKDGDSAVSELLGGSPQEIPGIYSLSSPMAMIPLNRRHLIMHGTLDDALPVESAREYARLARTAGDDVDFIEVPKAGHMDYLDIDSQAYALFRKWLISVVTL